MPAVQGSALPITIEVKGVDLTNASVTMAFGLVLGKKPTLTKRTVAGEIAVAYDGVAGDSTLTVTLSATETADWNCNVYYAIYIDDGTPGGDWIPDNGGTGVIPFGEAVLKS